MKTGLSIIIPVYNCDQYIERCVLSIIKQTSEFELDIIIVNDGSKDKSDEICRNLSLRYPNITYISQQNKGASCARNAGLERAKGEYIWFVDADDSVHHGSLQALWNIINKGHPPLIAFNYFIESDGGYYKVINHYTDSVVSISEYVRNNKALYIWNKLYRRDLLKDVRFLEGTKNIEDFMFNIEVMNKVEEILCVSQICYVYNTCNQNSTSRSVSKRNLIKLSQDSLLIHSELAHLLSISVLKSSWVKNLLYFSVAGHIFSLFRFYNVHHVLKAIRRYKEMGLYPLRYTDNVKANLMIFVINRFCFYKILCILDQKRIHRD